MSEKPLSRVLVLGDEATTLIVMGELQNLCAERSLAKSLVIESLIESPWTSWWFHLQGESKRYYCVVPRGGEAKSLLLSSQKFDCLLWIPEGFSPSRARERLLLRELCISRIGHVIVLLPEPSFSLEVIARELLSEARLPADDASFCVMGDTAETCERLLEALEGLAPSPPTPVGRFYMLIERVEEGALGSSLYGYASGPPPAVGGALHLCWRSRVVRTSVTELQVYDGPETGAPVRIMVPLLRGVWGVAVSLGLLSSHSSFSADVYGYTPGQGGFRRSWSPGDELTVKVREEERSAVVTAGTVRPGELREVLFRCSGVLLSLGERFFLSSGGVVFGVGVAKKLL